MLLWSRSASGGAPAGGIKAGKQQRVWRHRTILLAQPEQGVNAWMWNHVPDIVTGRGMSRTPAQEPSRASWRSGWERRFQDTAREVRDLDSMAGD